MSSFTKPVVLKILPHRNYEVFEEFEFYYDKPNGKRVVISIPKGFVTDLASVPRLFWSIFPPNGEYSKAAIVHDFIYRTRTLLISRKEADAIFLEGMKVLKVPAWRRYAIWLAVRLFGWLAYKDRFNTTIKSS